MKKIWQYLLAFVVMASMGIGTPLLALQSGELSVPQSVVSGETVSEQTVVPQITSNSSSSESLNILGSDINGAAAVTAGVVTANYADNIDGLVNQYFPNYTERALNLDDLIAATRATHTQATAGMTDAQVVDYLVGYIDGHSTESGVTKNSWNSIKGKIYEQLNQQALLDEGYEVLLYDKANYPALDGVLYRNGDTVYVQIKSNQTSSYAQIQNWIDSAQEYINTSDDFLSGEVNPKVKIILPEDTLRALESSKDAAQIKSMLTAEQIIPSPVSQSKIWTFLDDTAKASRASGLAVGELSGLQKLSSIISAKFPSAAPKLFAGLTAAKTGIGVFGKYILEPLGVILGPILTGIGVAKMIEVVKSSGVQGLFGTREGWASMLRTASGAVTTAAGASAIAALFTSETVVGGLTFGAIAGILYGVALALEATALVLENWEEIKAWVSNRIDELKRLGHNVVEGAKNIFNDYVAPALVAAGVFVKKVTQVAYQTYETVKRTVSRVVTKVKTVYETVKRTVTEWVKKTVNAVRQVAYQVKETAYRWVNKVKTVVKRVAYQVKETFYKAVQKFKTITKKVYYTVKEKAYRWLTKFKTITRQVAYQVRETAYRWVNQVRTISKRVAYTVYKTAYRWLNVTRRITRPITERIVSWVPQTVYNWVRSAWGWIKRKVTQYVQQVSYVTRYVTSYVTERVRQAYRYATTAYKTVSQQVTERVRQAYTYVATKYKTVSEKVAYQVKEAYTKLVTKSKKVQEKVAYTVKEAQTRLVTKYKNVAHKVTESVKEAYTKTVTKYKNEAYTYQKDVKQTREIEEQVAREVETQETIQETVEEEVPVTRYREEVSYVYKG